MSRTALKGSKLRSASHDQRTQRLEIEFDDGSLRIYKGVQLEVFRRLVAAPNAYAYFEDRIAEEYPWERASTNATDAKSKLDDLFG
jgi:KTSC domain